MEKRGKVSGPVGENTENYQKKRREKKKHEFGSRFGGLSPQLGLCQRGGTKGIYCGNAWNKAILSGNWLALENKSLLINIAWPGSGKIRCFRPICVHLSCHLVFKAEPRVCELAQEIPVHRPANQSAIGVETQRPIDKGSPPKNPPTKKGHW